MTERCFVDTNIILYAASHDPAEAAKHERALTLLDSTDVCVSAQVLQEFYVNAVRKARDPDAPDRIRAWIDRLATCPVVPTDLALVEAAIRDSVRYKI